MVFRYSVYRSDVKISFTPCSNRSVISFICCLRSTAMQALLFLDPSCFHLTRILVGLFRCFCAVPLQSPGPAFTGVPGSFQGCSIFRIQNVGDHFVVAHCPCCAVRRRIQSTASVRRSIRTQAVDLQRLAIVQPPRHRSAADSNAHQCTIFRYPDGELMSPCRLMVAVILLHKCVCCFQIDRC